MPNSESNSPVSGLVRTTSTIFMIVGALSCFLFPKILGHPHEGLDGSRIMIAGAVGAVSALVGAGVGFLIEKLRR
jgi:hypothetical protein